LRCRDLIDTNSEDGRNQADSLLNELIEKIESAYSDLKSQESYDLGKALDFQSAKDDFLV